MRPQLLMHSVQAHMRDVPELTQAYLNMSVKVLRSCPDLVFFDKQFASSVFQWFMSSLLLPEVRQLHYELGQRD